ncbi:hypothetical protein B005_2272 [Nocardiopsis alba ATCC BAA-2165]|uniref:Uncharacterized protein n=1 Tax=Nocardiopsis alba (strain ATCC BAA-2165 / BE74) TaxID=1205910 RepID=J7LAM9_NOCAA|nr:hypothetical protein B005_2272 [Nocardiopsis alba ATCC BAA-2165]
MVIVITFLRGRVPDRRERLPHRAFEFSPLSQGSSFTRASTRGLPKGPSSLLPGRRVRARLSTLVLDVRSAAGNGRGRGFRSGVFLRLGRRWSTDGAAVVGQGPRRRRVRCRGTGILPVRPVRIANTAPVRGCSP